MEDNKWKYISVISGGITATALAFYVYKKFLWIPNPHKYPIPHRNHLIRGTLF